MTSEKAKEIIQSMADPYSAGSKLRCEAMGLNGNWIVSTSAKRKDDIEYVVLAIQYNLNIELENNKGKMK